MKCPHVDPDPLLSETPVYYLLDSEKITDNCCRTCWEKLTDAGQVSLAGFWRTDLHREVVVLLEGWVE